jgi:undecaprenyl-diphosphatase
MTHLVAIILGFVEGATEFIPVSSSGHLIIARQILGVNDSSGLAFDAIIQLATSCALLLYFWRDVVRLFQLAWMWLTRQPIESREKILLYAIVLGTIPAVVFGLLLETKMDTIFRNVHLVAYALIAGSLLFWYAQYASKKFRDKHADLHRPLTVWSGIIIGFYQCLALVPGVSRSGATISGGLIEGLTMADAVRFSFLLSLPVLFGAGLKELWSVHHELLASGITSNFDVNLLLGSVVAFVTGLIAINYLMKYLKTHNLNVFIWYRIIVAVVILFIF